MKKSIHTWLRALRVNQWTKNGIVFLAWFFAVADPSQAAMARGIRPFILVAAMATAFCLVSSAFYLLNDVADFDADRLHPVKRLRPVAAGLVSRIDAVRVALSLFAIALMFPCYLVFRHPDRTWGFAVILIYSVMQCAYSGFLKRIPYIDVVVIAAGFVLRAVAGAAAMNVRISPWLLACAFALSLFIALAKFREGLLIGSKVGKDIRQPLKRGKDERSHGTHGSRDKLHPAANGRKRPRPRFATAQGKQDQRYNRQDSGETQAVVLTPVLDLRRGTDPASSELRHSSLPASPRSEQSRR